MDTTTTTTTTTEKNTLIHDIISILQNALETLDNGKGMALTSTEVVFINQLMKESPQSFQDISTEITGILEKRAVEISDIPQLLYIIATVYIKDFRHKDVDIIACIRYTLETIIGSGLLPINAVEERVLKTVIETSLNLLKTNLPYIEEIAEEVVEEVVKEVTKDAGKMAVCFKRYLCFC